MNLRLYRIIQLQIRSEIVLFFKLKHFKHIALIKTLLWCAIFSGLHINVMKILVTYN